MLPYTPQPDGGPSYGGAVNNYFNMTGLNPRLAELYRQWRMQAQQNIPFQRQLAQTAQAAPGQASPGLPAPGQTPPGLSAQTDPASFSGDVKPSPGPIPLIQNPPPGPIPLINNPRPMPVQRARPTAPTRPQQGPGMPVPPINGVNF